MLCETTSTARWVASSAEEPIPSEANDIGRLLQPRRPARRRRAGVPLSARPVRRRPRELRLRGRTGEPVDHLGDGGVTRGGEPPGCGERLVDFGGQPAEALAV